MKLIKVISVALLFGLGFFAYVVFTSFSEHREYKTYSIDYWLLTPKYIGDLAKLCKTEPRFVYSAADGPKPTITRLNCSLADDGLDYLIQKSFAKVSNSSFKKDNQEIEITRSDNGGIVAISLLEFL